MLCFFPRGVLDEILNLIESVSEDFPSYSCSNDSAMLNKMATRAINRNKLLMTSSDKSVDRF